MKKFLYLNENFVSYPSRYYHEAPAGKINGYKAYYDVSENHHKIWANQGVAFTWIQLVRLTKDTVCCGKTYNKDQYALLIQCDSDITSVRTVLEKIIPNGIVVDKETEKIGCRLVSKESEGRKHTEGDDAYAKVLMVKNKDYSVTEQVLFSEKRFKSTVFNGGIGFAWKYDKVVFTEQVEVDGIVVQKDMLGYVLYSNRIDMLKKFFSDDNTYYIEYSEETAKKVRVIEANAR